MAPDTASGTFSTGARALITVAAAVVVFAGVWFARDILAPLAVAAVVVIIAHPLRYPLERRGWPRWAATTAVIVVAYLILAVLAALLVFALAQFAGLVPQFTDELTAFGRQLTELVESVGLGAEAADAAASVVAPDQLAAFAGGIASALLSFATAFFFVLAYVIFMAADAARASNATVPVFGGGRGDAIAGRYFSGVRRYYVVNATFGAIVAVLDGLLLWIIGVPIPLVWAILSFVTNFVPNIGFVLGLVPPAVLALVVGGWPLALVVVLGYSVINVVLQVLVQPKFVSDAVDLSLVLSFVSVVFWTFVIGPAGAILSIPLTLLVRALFVEPDPRARVLHRLTLNRPDREPAT